MHKRFLAFSLTGCLLAGCGFGLNPARTGSLRFSAVIPQSFRTQLIHQNTHSIFVLIYKPGQRPETARRPEALTATNPTLTIPNIDVGAQVVLTVAMDCEGRMLTSARKEVTIRPAPELTRLEVELSESAEKDFNAGEMTEIKTLKPKCLPQPTPTPVSNPVTTPNPGQPIPIPGTPVSPVPGEAPTPGPSPTPQIITEQALQLELDIREGGDRVIQLQAQLKGNPAQAAQVRRVDYFVNDVKIADSASAPYPASWETNPRSPGSYRIKGIAFDSQGRELAVSGTSTILLLVRDQISVSSGSGGGGGSIIIQPPPPAPTPTPVGIDVGTPGGASFSAEVTIADGSSTPGAITVESP